MIRTLTAAAAAAVVSLSLYTTAWAHPGHVHDDEPVSRSLRTWTDSTGFFQLEATYVMAKDGKVQLRKKDDSLVTFSIDRLSQENQSWIEKRTKELHTLNTQVPRVAVALAAAKVAKPKSNANDAPSIRKHFEPFADTLKFRWDDEHFFVESNGMPDHPMMIGITAWQQQLPLPQSYTGDNAWRIPLNPVPAKQPISAKTHFFRGAIALAVNGVPIFNPFNNRREDTNLIGELDKWGGHSGRADDYHYHIAPVHLQKTVGKGNPVAYALDGYPIYGYTEPDGSKVQGLDWLNGHKDADGHYHYHASKTYPYLNGGFYGEVVERDGQVDPQPRAQPLRPSLTPLRDARITGFSSSKPGNYRVELDVRGEKRSVDYAIADDGSVTYKFTDSSGTRTETHRPRTRDAGGRRGRDADARGEDEDGRRRDRGGRGRDAGGDPLQRALDANGDGTIDADELKKAAEIIRSLDRNDDGQISRDEIRGSGDRQDDNQRPPGDRTREERGGPQTSDGPRQPWILVHAEEVDLNKDGIVSRDEIVGEAEKAFGGYDQNEDGELSESELNSRGNVRSAMGGFIKGHAKELDRNNDGNLTRTEAIDNATRMFSRVDADGDGRVTKTELEASRRTEDEPQGRRKPRG